MKPRIALFGLPPVSTGRLNIWVFADPVGNTLGREIYQAINDESGKILDYVFADIEIGLCGSLKDLLKQKKGGKTGLLNHLPDYKILDELTHQMVTMGFLFLTVGIITGAVWANSAWGTYWSWDPKETWSLITWFVYATLLHARMMRGWEGKKIAYLSIIGFMAVIFTYFGVNLLPGLHTYGQG